MTFNKLMKSKMNTRKIYFLHKKSKKMNKKFWRLQSANANLFWFQFRILWTYL